MATLLRKSYRICFLLVRVLQRCAKTTTMTERVRATVGSPIREETSSEVKSIQTNSVKNLGNQWTGRAQVDASDSRDVVFPDGTSLKTTCLLRGQFDVLAINCFAFGGQWRFAFALNSELPANTYRRYTEYQRQHLLPTLITVDWPLRPPFKEDPNELLEILTAI